MIWATAKSTDVSSRQMPRPSWASGFVGRARGARRPDGGRCRHGKGLDADRGAARGAAGDLERGGEVGLQVLDVLEPDRHAQQTRA